jgi:hypothetical protein
MRSAKPRGWLTAWLVFTSALMVFAWSVADSAETSPKEQAKLAEAKDPHETFRVRPKITIFCGSK